MASEPERSADIRTPDQRLRVFVSSTLAELGEERRAVARAVASLRLTPVLFELGARPHPPRELYRAYLQQSDIFIGLYWQRYGWIAPDMQISGLEDEFRLSQSMPRLLYVKDPAPDRDARLTALIDDLEAQATESYRSFGSPSELGRLVRDDLATLLSERFQGSRGGSDSSSASARQKRALPSASTSLIGREQDISRVCDLLQETDVRLVTLTGPGGIGKSRLALAVAERMAERDGLPVVFVPLAPITQPKLVLPRIATEVGAALEGTQSPLDVLAEHLADKAYLLVLDNLEQVVGVAAELAELLARCPGLKILATSRVVLRLRAEHEYAVGPLIEPGSTEHAAKLVAAQPAVELFVDRARAVRRDFSLNEDETLAVAEICRRLDGLPLAIELAAARARLLSPSALLARLSGSLEGLGSGPVDLPERQRTLRATMEWSVGLLDAPEREMLGSLSVFVDGCTIEAAAYVSGTDEERTLDLLDDLSRHSLVTVTGDFPEQRFGMLATVREFAAEMAAAGPDFNDIERRHAAHFRRFVEETKWPLPNERAWAERLRAEEGNLRRAIRWFFTNDVTPLPRILSGLWRFWQLSDGMTDGRAWIEELLPRAASFDERGQAELWLTAAMTALEAGDDERALTAIDHIDRLLPVVSDPHLQSTALLARSWALPLVGDLDGARLAASNALGAYEEQDEPYLAANARFTLGMLELTLGSHEIATRHLAEIDSGEAGASWLTTVARVELAWLAVDAGRLDEARDRLIVSEDLRRAAERSTLILAFCLVARAKLALAEGDGTLAAQALGAAGALRERAGLRAWPMLRPAEARLLDGVRQALEPVSFEEAFAAGAGFDRRESLALLQGDTAQF